MNNETWMKIEDYDDYEISNHGRVRSFKRDKVNGKFMKQTVDRYGYPMLSLCKDGIVNKFRVHRLVADHFLLKPEDDQTDVDHIDRDKVNNHYSNLRWSSKSENSKNRQVYGSLYERTQSRKDGSSTRSFRVKYTFTDGHTEHKTFRDRYSAEAWLWEKQIFFPRVI